MKIAGLLALAHDDKVPAASAAAQNLSARKGAGHEVHRRLGPDMKTPRRKLARTRVVIRDRYILEACENKKVLLIDGNLNTPEVASSFQLENVRGLSNALREDTAPANFVVEVDGVHILPGGDPVDNPADILAT